MKKKGWPVRLALSFCAEIRLNSDFYVPINCFHIMKTKLGRIAHFVS